MTLPTPPPDAPRARAPPIRAAFGRPFQARFRERPHARVTPANPAAKVPDPTHGGYLPAAGLDVELTAYWLARYPDLRRQPVLSRLPGVQRPERGQLFVGR